MMTWENGKRYYSILFYNRTPLPKEVEKKCGRFYCQQIEQPACCAACPRFMSCDRACLNDPERCGLAAEN